MACLKGFYFALVLIGIIFSTNGNATLKPNSTTTEKIQQEAKGPVLSTISPALGTTKKVPEETKAPALSTIPPNSEITAPITNFTTISPSLGTSPRIQPRKGPVSCQNANPRAVAVAALKGEWFEVARKPKTTGHDNKQCVKMIMSYNALAISLQHIYSNNSNKLSHHESVNYTQEYTIQEHKVEPIFYYQKSHDVTKVYRILDTDYSQYAFVCDFDSKTGDGENLKPNDTAGAFILVREKHHNNHSFLDSIIRKAKQNYLDFQNLEKVIQSDQCYPKSGSSVHGLSLMLVVAVAIILGQ